MGTIRVHLVFSPGLNTRATKSARRCSCIRSRAIVFSISRPRQAGREGRTRGKRREKHGVSPYMGGDGGAEWTSTSGETGAFRIITPGKWHFKWLMGIKKKNVSFDPVGESAAISIHACYAPPRRAEMVPPARRRTRSEIKSAKSVRARRPPLPFAASLFGGEERSRAPP